MNSLKMKHENVKKKLNNMEQLQMEYWEVELGMLVSLIF